MDERTEIVTTIHPNWSCGPAGRTWQAYRDRSWTIGRANEADIHGRESEGVPRPRGVAADAGGMGPGQPQQQRDVRKGRRVESLTIGEPVTVMLGSVSSGEALQITPLSNRSSPAGTPATPEPPPHLPDQAVATTVARPPTAVHAIDQLVVPRPRSRQQRDPGRPAGLPPPRLLRRSDNRWELVDNNSANGTYVNGNRINSADHRPQRRRRIGHQLLHLADGRLVEYVDTGDISYQASNLRVVTTRARYCDRRQLRPTGTLLHGGRGTERCREVDIIGRADGFRPAGSGEVRYDDRDLYKNRPS